MSGINRALFVACTCSVLGVAGWAKPCVADEAQTGYLVANKAFRAAAQKVLPSVVSIETFGGLGGKVARRGQSSGISKPGDGPTTGVIISPDGYIITSTYNFLRKPSVITVVLRDGSQHVATLLGSDETRKLCLLKIEGVSGLPVPEHAIPADLRVGQWAISVGIGYGDTEPAISAGIISALNRVFGRAVQTDANISPANYGGPLVDVEGRMIGLCVPLSPMSASLTAGSEWYDSGIGFAVPLHGADSLIADLKAGKVIKPGRIGVQPKPVVATAGNSPSGAAIARVLPDSPAAKAGLHADDVILAVEDDSVFDAAHLRTLLARYVAGDQVSLKIKRGDEELSIDVALEAGEEQTAAPMPMPIPNPAEPKPMGDEPKPDSK